MPKRLWHPTFPGVHVDVTAEQVPAHKRAGWRTTPAGATPTPEPGQARKGRKTPRRARGHRDTGEAAG